MLTTICLLAMSNIFMTWAWYGHLRHRDMPMIMAVLASWGIAFFEYCLMVPANRIGHRSGISAPTLKVIQEGITLVVFAGFSTWWLGEPLRLRHMAAFALVFAAVIVATVPWGEPAE